ncbi:MAG: O-antigen ligase family protein [Steroidobacteraceae bacterium]
MISAQLAIGLYTGLILWFFVRDRTLRPMTSGALWLPLLWLAIVGTRPVSFWWTTGARPDRVEVYLDGSPVDAAIYIVLIALGSIVLLRRRLDWRQLVGSNPWVAAFFGYCLLGILWSDFAFVSFKRCVKDLGNVVMILVILSEADPTAATRAMLARYTYVAIPLSVLFIKYVPNLGRYYDPWTWQPMYRGVGGEKNALGVTVTICGLFLVWEIIDAWGRKRAARPAPVAAGKLMRARVVTRRRAVPDAALPPSGGAAHLAHRPAWAIGTGPPFPWWDAAGRLLLLVMCVWLMGKADSSNALVCLWLGIAAAFMAQWSASGAQRFLRHLGSYALLIAAAVLFVYAVPGVLDTFLRALGEDPTLTGRVELWTDLLAIPNNMLVGSGYQSFWLGSGIDALWAKYYFKPNQAHNGYLDTYLNGGIIGIVLLGALILAGAAKLKRQLLQRVDGSVLQFAFFVIVVFYNWSEAMFNHLTPVWFVMLLAVIEYQHGGARLPVPARRAQVAASGPTGPRVTAGRATASGTAALKRSSNLR